MDDRNAIMDKALLKDLLQLEKTSSRHRDFCEEQYSRRFGKIIAPFIENKIEFSEVMLKTETYISGSLALLFFDPDFYANDAKTDKHDMDLYTTSDGITALLVYLIQKEGYCVQEPDGFYSERRTTTSRFYFRSRRQTGIKKIYKLQKGELKIDVIESSGEHAFVSILHFHFTIPMNALNPVEFISFYPSFTMYGAGMFSEKSFVRGFDPNGYGERLLKDNVKAACAKYERRGFCIKESPNSLERSHAASCLFGACRQVRYVDDCQTLRVNFGKAKRPTLPTNIVIRWSLGGYKCGGHYSDAEYCPFFVDVLSL